MAKLYGQVTRLIPADESRGVGARIYFWPHDEAATRYIDGRHKTAAGEVAVFVLGDPDAYQVGGACAVEYDPDDPAKAPKLVPLAPPVAVQPPAVVSSPAPEPPPPSPKSKHVIG